MKATIKAVVTKCEVCQTVKDGQRNISEVVGAFAHANLGVDGHLHGFHGRPVG